MTKALALWVFLVGVPLVVVLTGVGRITIRRRPLTPTKARKEGVL